MAAAERRSKFARSIKRDAVGCRTLVAMSSSIRPDRLRELVDLALENLDRGLDGRSLADRAYLSRFHFDRLLTSGLGEPPAHFRRRLLVERAAWQLLRGAGVTEAGLDAGYGSTEAFSRAFRRTFGKSPSEFARTRGDYRVEAPNGIHFHPPAGLHVPGDQRRTRMDLTDRLVEHDRWLTARLLERAAGLTDEELDREIRPGHQVLSFDGPEPSVRAMLDRLVWTKEVWVAALTGSDFPPEPSLEIAALRRRLSAAGDAFVAAVRNVRERDGWDDAFVDALCDPPQAFTYGAVVAHVLTYSAYRRQVLLEALLELGVDELEPGCPIEWERLHAAERPKASGVLRGAGR
jgi:AraC family transcriptional regulator